MAIISMLQITLTNVVESTIVMKEELPVRWNNITRYHQANSNNEELDDWNEEDHHKTKRKDFKVQFNAIRRGVYCHNYYNEILSLKNVHF